MITKREKIIITCGIYDPISTEELKLIMLCKKKGDWLIVGIHTDLWMEKYLNHKIVDPFQSRFNRIHSLSFVDEVFRFDDTDGTNCKFIQTVKLVYPNADIIYVSPVAMTDKPETKISGIKFETIK